MTTATRPAGPEIYNVVNQIASTNAGKPLAATLSEVAAYFSGSVFTTEEARSAKAAIERLVDESILSSIKQVGDSVGDFSLPDADGRTVSLSQVLRRGPAVIVFYRGQWCPYCNLHLSRFQRHLEQFKALDATLLAISPQSPDHSERTQENNGLTYSVLSDVGSHVARQFGVAYDEPEAMAQLHETFGVHLKDFNGGDPTTLPVPATFVIASNGKVAWVNADIDYTNRSEPSDVLAAVRDLSTRR